MEELEEEGGPGGDGEGARKEDGGRMEEKWWMEEYG